ncbi:MAG: hypothetical protein KIT44_05080 [Opitutaceae bacterium]|nr:hypothetical protein [Opitutaceae bacterium]
MSHLASLPSPAVNAAAGHAPVRPNCWKLAIIGEPESGLLLRVLQRLLVQQAVVGSLRYDQVRGEAQLEISFLADEEHARLAARRCETLIAVRRVSLEASP